MNVKDFFMNICLFIFFCSAPLLCGEESLQLQNTDLDTKFLLQASEQNETQEPTDCIICFEPIKKESPRYFCSSQFEGTNHSETIHNHCQNEWVKKKLLIIGTFCWQKTTITQICCCCNQPLMTKKQLLKHQKEQTPLKQKSSICCIQ